VWLFETTLLEDLTALLEDTVALLEAVVVPVLVPPMAFALNAWNFLPGLMANTIPCWQCVDWRQNAQTESVVVTVISAPENGPLTSSAATALLREMSDT
jgi:hypothetical protein